MSYWVIKRGDEYLQVNSGAFRPNRESAVRFFEMPTHLAEDERRVYVRTCPPSERPDLAARLAAWEPVVRAACEWAEDDGASEEGIYHAVRALPKEHRP